MEIRIRCPQCRTVLPMDIEDLLSDPEVSCDACGAELSVGIDLESLRESSLGAALQTESSEYG